MYFRAEIATVTGCYPHLLMGKGGTPICPLFPYTVHFPVIQLSSVVCLMMKLKKKKVSKQLSTLFPSPSPPALFCSGLTMSALQFKTDNIFERICNCCK